MNVILSGGTVVTMDPDRRILEHGAVAVRGDQITAVGIANDLKSKFVDFETIDCTGRIVIPGFVNTHLHMFQGLLKGLGDDWVLKDWLRNVTLPAAAVLTPDDCRAAAMLGCLESIKSGATTILDFMYPHNRPGLSVPIIEAMTTSGLRGLYGRGFINQSEAGQIPEAILEDFDQALQDCSDLFERYNGSGDGRIGIWVAPCAVWSANEESLRATRKIASDLGMRITIHVAETPYEIENSRDRFGLADVPYYESIDFLGPDVLAVHCIYLTEEDVAILAGTHTRVSHNPVSNMYLASGVAPIPEMIRAGITVGIATDGPASNNNQNMLSQLKYTALVHKVNTRDPTIITAEKVLELATIGGAKAVGLEGTIGPIEVGKKADIVVVNLENSHAGPVHRPVSSLVYSAIGSEVETVMVNGELLMKDRRLLTLDEEEILANANQAAFSLAKRIGIDRPSGYIWREPT